MCDGNFFSCLEWSCLLISEDYMVYLDLSNTCDKNSYHFIPVRRRRWSEGWSNQMDLSLAKQVNSSNFDYCFRETIGPTQ